MVVPENSLLVLYLPMKILLSAQWMEWMWVFGSSSPHHKQNQQDIYPPKHQTHHHKEDHQQIIKIFPLLIEVPHL